MSASSAPACVLLAAAILALTGVTGRLLVGLGGPRRLRVLRPFEGAFSAVLGLAAWTVLLTAASAAGLRMPAALGIAAALHAAAFVVVLARGRGGVLLPRGSPRAWGAVLLPAGLLVLVALYPVLRHGRFAAENDSLLYAALAQWYTDHSFAEPVEAAGRQPLSHYAAIYGEAGYPIGPAFLLSGVAVAARATSPLSPYPVVSACGLVLGLVALLGVGRRVLRWPLSFTAAAGLGLAVLLQPWTWAHHMGFLAQTWGTPLLIGALAHGASLRSAARWQGSDAVVAALLAAGLACTYPPFLVPLTAGAGAWLADHLAGGTPRRPLFRFVLWVGAGTFLLGWLQGFDPVRAFRYLGQTQVGGHVGLSPLGYLQASFGAWVYVPFRLGRAGEALRAAQAWAWPVLAALAARGLWLWARTRVGRTLLAPGLAFAVAFLWYALFALDPWTGERGHTWNLYKLTGWSFPLLALALLHGLATLRANRWGRALARGLGLAALALAPLSVAFADRLGQDLETFVGTKPALATWETLRASFGERPQAWYLAADTPATSTPFLPTYLGLLTYPHRLSGDWEGGMWVPPDPTDGAKRLFDALARGQREVDGLPVVVVLTALRGRITEDVERLEGAAVGLVRQPSSAHVTAFLQPLEPAPGPGGCTWIGGARTALRVYSPVAGGGLLRMTKSAAPTQAADPDVELPLRLARGGQRLPILFPDGWANRDDPRLCVLSATVIADGGAR